MEAKAVNVQCVYGETHLSHIRNCLIPALREASNRPIKLLSMNYNPSSRSRLGAADTKGVEVIDIVNTAMSNTGFAENHNLLFSSSTPDDFFVILNPDCIPQKGSIDALIARKSASSEKVGIVEGRQWPFEHPKEYDALSLHTPWASGAFSLIDAEFYRAVGGMDDLYFLYMEDVDLSWQAWINGYSVIYEPTATVAHFTGGHFYRDDIVSAEQYLSLRNFLIIARKFFGIAGEIRAIDLLKSFPDVELANAAIDEYLEKHQHLVTEKYWGKKNPHVKIVGLNQFHELRNV